MTSIRIPQDTQDGARTGRGGAQHAQAALPAQDTMAAQDTHTAQGHTAGQGSHTVQGSHAAQDQGTAQAAATEQAATAAQDTAAGAAQAQTITPRKRKCGRRPVRLAREQDRAILADAIRDPTISTRALAARHAVDRSTVDAVLRRYHNSIKDIDDFKRGRADILAGKQQQIVAAMTQEKIASASLRDLAVAYGILADKERLERGLSTDNIASLSRVLQATDRLEYPPRDAAAPISPG